MTSEKSKPVHLEATRLQDDSVETRAGIEYVKLNDIDPGDFIPILNDQKIRKHLIEHDLFDVDTARSWVETKIETDSNEGCKVRAIVYEDRLVGWCGIQFEDGEYGMAIIIDQQFWGLGKVVFHDLMRWAKDLGHDEIFIHLRHSRPEYRFLRKTAKKVYERELLGEQFTVYLLPVS